MMRQRRHIAAILFITVVAAQVIGLTTFAAVQEAKLRSTEVTLKTSPSTPAPSSRATTPSWTTP